MKLPRIEKKNNDKLKEDLADVLFLMFKLSDKKDISLEEAFIHKFETIKKIFE